MLAFRMLRPLVIIAALLCGGWDYVEHLSIGTQSYKRACEKLRADFAASTDAGIKTRLGIACDNLEIASQLYGQATALAGDRFGGPQDFMSTRAGWKVASTREYYSL